MNNPIYLSGKTVSDFLLNGFTSRIKKLKERKYVPGLAVILIGNHVASKLYVKSKTRIFKRLELYTETFNFLENVSENDIINKIKQINENILFHGILVQLPLPKHINQSKIINCIDPKKDVDGFHPFNTGLLSIGEPSFIPCTPKGIIKILDHYNINLVGKNIVVIGRSNIVGRPISILTTLKKNGLNGTTTLCHSGTPNIIDYTKNADIIILAIGKPKFLKANMVKKGSVVIDVGINRIEADNSKGYSIVGDADLENLGNKVSAITPVPGGVGLMTIAMLVDNTIESAEKYCARSSVG